MAVALASPSGLFILRQCELKNSFEIEAVCPESAIIITISTLPGEACHGKRDSEGMTATLESGTFFHPGHSAGSIKKLMEKVRITDLATGSTRACKPTVAFI